MRKSRFLIGGKASLFREAGYLANSGNRSGTGLLSCCDAMESRSWGSLAHPTPSRLRCRSDAERTAWKARRALISYFWPRLRRNQKLPCSRRA